MTWRRTLAFTAGAVLTGCVGPLTCARSPNPSGQFGEYHDANLVLWLPGGDTVTVYRVKYWTFYDGEPPALQLEYASRAPTTDTEAVLAFGRTLWPAFVPYVERMRLTHAVLTATQVTDVKGGSARFVSRHSYGVTAELDLDGMWRFQGHPEPLPTGDPSGKPRIHRPNGTPFEFLTAPPLVR
jgi:hypothetical protein